MLTFELQRYGLRIISDLINKYYLINHMSLTTKTFSIVLFSFLSLSVFAQDYHLKLVDIVNKSADGYREPEKYEASPRGGMLEFSVEYKGNCKAAYRLSWRFEEIVSMINARNLKETPLTYSLTAEPIKDDCKLLKPAKYPSVIFGTDSGGSRILEDPQFRDSYQPRGKAFRKNSQTVYFKNDGTSKPMANYKDQTILYSSDLYAGKYVYFFFRVIGLSDVDSFQKSTWYEIVYVFKVMKGVSTP